MSRPHLFIGIDVETVRRNHGICEFAAIGVDPEGACRFRFASLVDPGPGEWVPMCVAKHGINQEEVRGKPGFNLVWDRFLSELADLTPGYCMVAHKASFERSAITADLGLSTLPLDLGCSWMLAKQQLQGLDSYSLDAVCRALNIDLLRHHRAEPDAMAAAHIARILHSQPVVEAKPLPSAGGNDWIPNETRGRNCDILANTQRRGDRLRGEVIVFTGGFANGIQRQQAKELAVSQGATPADSITGKTTILVVAGVGHPIPPDSLTSGKMKEAIIRGIPLMSEPEFLERAGWPASC